MLSENLNRKAMFKQMACTGVHPQILEMEGCYPNVMNERVVENACAPEDIISVVTGMLVEPVQY